MPGPPVSGRRRRTVGVRGARRARLRSSLVAAMGRVGLPRLRGLRARRLLRRRLLLRLVGLVGAAHLVEARLQRGHEVGHRRGLLLAHGLDGDLLAGRLALDEVKDLVAVGVAGLLGLERARQRLDELLGDRQLLVGRRDVAGLRDLVDALGIDDLVGVEHRRHPEDVALRADRDEVLLGADDDVGDRDLARLGHRLEQQAVGLGPARAGRQVVRVGVEDGGDLGKVDEVLDVDRARLDRLEGLELAGVDEDVAVGGDLVALDEALVGHLLAGRRVDALLGDAHAVLGIQLVEADGLALDGAVELDGDGDEPEGDRAGPDRAGHGSLVCPIGTGGPSAAGGLAGYAVAPLPAPACAWTWCSPSANSSIILALKAGRSSGLRLVTRPSSTWTSSSTHVPPAFSMSVLIEGKLVSVRPLTASASTSVHGPWQIAAIGLPAFTKPWTNLMASSSVRRLSGLATPPGSISPS